MPIYDYTSLIPRRSQRPRKPRHWVFITMLLGIGAIFGLSGGSDTESTLETEEPAHPLGVADTLTIAPEPPAEIDVTAEWTEINGRIGRGENFSEALIREGLAREQIFELVPALRRDIHRAEFNPNIVPLRDRYTVLLDTAGVIQKFEYLKRGDLERRFLATRENGMIKAWAEAIPLRREVVVVADRVEDSIWRALSGAGENPDALTAKLEYIFEYYIDFMVDCRSGDRFSFAVEKLFNQEGAFVRYGEIVAARYESVKESETYQAFLYIDPDGNDGYFDAEGKSLQGIFLKKPLNFTRISSKFSSRRFHPILKKYIPHHGVDYAAPYGTKVWAIADGVVSFIGRKGPLGNYIEIKHKNGYKTGYGHLSKFASGLSRGMRIRQKQTIGYVGATGRATGPHLHFNFYATINGRYQITNPDRQINRPTGKPVPPTYLAHFQEQQHRLLTLLENDSGAVVTAALPPSQSSPIAEE